MRRVPIRLKLLAALAVPLAVLMVVTVLEVAAISREVAEVKRDTELAESSLGPSSLAISLQWERAAAAVHMIGMQDAFKLAYDNNEDARELVNGSLRDLIKDIDAGGEEERAAYAPVLAAFHNLPIIRAEVDAVPPEDRNLMNVEEASATFDRYTEIMEAVSTANQDVSGQIDEDVLRRGAELLDIAGIQTDLLARLVRVLLLPAVTGDADGVNTPDEVMEVISPLDELRANEARTRILAGSEYGPMADALFDTDHIVEFPAQAEETLETGEVDITAVSTTATGPDADSFGYVVFRDAVAAELTSRAADIRAAADARLRRYLIFAGVAALVALLTTWLVSRSITRPLQSLTRQAREMARERLPEAVRSVLAAPLGQDVEVPQLKAIQVQTSDEVVEVAEALNTVQESALDLAVEQAVLRRNISDSFVNLGRRNQNLLGRQLDFITQLEADEADPDVLDSLFRLDHLATRMRRNAESLLVLAGIDPPRQWSRPVRISDVVRAAVGEVEDYQRVDAQRVEQATIQGRAAADVIHLLAELIENSLGFSAPQLPVYVQGRRDEDGGYLIAVMDAGVGMAPEAMSRANRRLAGDEEFTVAPSKYLGHYVTGHLASRHGVRVWLRPTQGISAGITAVVELPSDLVADDEVPAAPAVPPAPGQAAVGQATVDSSWYSPA